MDQALYRRFDDIIKFEKPKFNQICLLIQNRLSLFDTDDFDWDRVAEAADGLSSAEITRSCEDAAKEAVLSSNEIEPLSSSAATKSKYAVAHIL